MAAVKEAASVQEMGFKYIPLTFDQWFDRNFTECDQHGHDFIPEMGFDNVIVAYVCRACGQTEGEQ